MKTTDKAYKENKYTDNKINQQIIISPINVKSEIEQPFNILAMKLQIQLMIQR